MRKTCLFPLGFFCCLSWFPLPPRAAFLVMFVVLVVFVVVAFVVAAALVVPSLALGSSHFAFPHRHLLALISYFLAAVGHATLGSRTESVCARTRVCVCVCLCLCARVYAALPPIGETFAFFRGGAFRIRAEGPKPPPGSILEKAKKDIYFIYWAK